MKCNGDHVASASVKKCCVLFGKIM